MANDRGDAAGVLWAAGMLWAAPVGGGGGRGWVPVLPSERLILGWHKELSAQAHIWAELWPCCYLGPPGCQSLR